MILFVEDENILQFIVGKVLTDRHYEVVNSATVKEGVASFEARSADIRLAIVDLMLDDGLGWDVAEAIWRTRPDVNVVLTSGYVTVTPPPELTVPDGRLHFLNKPYEMSDLVAMVENLATPA